jgi:hypothetical protein
MLTTRKTAIADFFNEIGTFLKYAECPQWGWERTKLHCPTNEKAARLGGLSVRSGCRGFHTIAEKPRLTFQWVRRADASFE